jgi:hypothetical protein
LQHNLPLSLSLFANIEEKKNSIDIHPRKTEEEKTKTNVSVIEKLVKH